MTALFAEPANDNEPAINSRDLAVLDAGHEPATLDAYFERTGTDGGWTAGPPRHGKPRVIINPDGDAERRRIADRQAIGARWDGKPANDNDYWPLLKALRDTREAMDDKERMTVAAIAYREIEAKASNPNPLRGIAYDGTYRLDQRTWVNRSGELVYKGLRRVDTDEPIPASQARRIVNHDDGVQSGGHGKMAVKWEGDAGLIAMIDAKPLLAMLRSKLGPLQQPFEDAVVFSRSLTDIGFDEGAANGSTASGIGKGLVYRGLRVIAGALEELALSKSRRRAV